MQIPRAVLFVTAVMGGLAAGFVATAQAPRSQWSGVYTREQAERGATTYRLKCSPCHAHDATGGTFGGDVGRGPALVGRKFSTDWDSATLADLFEVIHLNMPLDDAGSLSPQQVADIMAFLLKTGGYPEGNAELPSDVEQLKTYRFFAKNPDSPAKP
jgi:quinoprotein glucose dehydrogenase